MPNPLPALMLQSTRRIGNAVDVAMDEVGGFVRGTGREVGESAHRLGAEPYAWDAEDTPIAEPSEPASGPLHGLDRNGRYIEFTFEQVRVVPLRSHDGKLIGASFPSRPDDITRIQRWARSRHISANHEYYPQWAASDVATRKRHAVPISQGGSSPQPAPWGDNPIVVNGHANGGGYAIEVEDLDSREYEPVFTGSIVFGRLVEKSNYIRRAWQRNPGSPLLQVSCSPAEDGGDAHALFAGYLHRNGFDRDIWAAKDMVNTYRSGRLGVVTSIAPDGSMVAPFVVTRAPRSSSTPWTAGDT